MNSLRFYLKRDSLTKALVSKMKIAEDNFKNLELFFEKIEARGFNFKATGALASFYLCLACNTKFFKPPFYVNKRRVIDDHDGDIKKCEAILYLVAGDQKEFFVADGNGPVNALNSCLVKGVTHFFHSEKSLIKVKLLNYSVVTLNKEAGSAAKIRVVAVFSDGESQWTTIGCDENLITASFRAIEEGYLYPFLMKKVKSIEM